MLLRLRVVKAVRPSKRSTPGDDDAVLLLRLRVVKAVRPSKRSTPGDDDAVVAEIERLSRP